MTRQILHLMRSLTLLGLLALAVVACEPDETTVTEQPTVPTSEFDAHLAQEWMIETYNTVKNNGLFALDASRIYAYTAIAMYESMVHGIPGHRSLAGQLNGLTALPKPEAGKRYDWGIVLCHTTPQVVRALTPNMNAGSEFSLFAMADRQADEIRRENELDREVIDNSKAFGDQLARAIIQYAAADGRDALGAKAYVERTRQGNPQFWTGATLNQTFMMPYWWESRPLVIDRAQVCQPEPPYAYSENPNNVYYQDVKEVFDASLDPTKVEIGRFWANNPGQSGSPAGSWLGIANQLVDQLNLDIVTTLKMYVLLACGTRDGFISCWYSKYFYNLQRPVTFIREVMGASNWSSPVPTPPYPDYTSGTSVNAGASSTVLTHLFGNRSFVDNQHGDKGFRPRNFNSFREAGIEAYHSRIYAGVHMRRACEEGFKQGSCIAQSIINKIKFE